jgi:hypothetical protein
VDSGICVQRRDTLICRLASVIREMLGNRVSTSVDYPNLYRHRHGQGTTYRLAGA